MKAVGVTGTRDGMTKIQLSAFAVLLSRIAIEQPGLEFHHGDCVGADEEAHHIAQMLRMSVVIHPPTNDKARAYCHSATILPPAPYLERNHHIVNASDFMFVLPKEVTPQLRSGTWATFRYAELTQTRACIIFPNGNWELYQETDKETA